MAKLVGVFGEVKRVLRDDGLCFVNLGDSYAGSGVHSASHANPGLSRAAEFGGDLPTPIPNGLKPLDLCNIPHRVAQALQADGWLWRGTWHWIKRSPMPESLSGTRWERHRVKVQAEDKTQRTEAEALGGFRAHTGYEITSGATWQSCPGCAACTYPGRPERNGWVLRRGSWRWTDAVEYVFLLAKQPGYTALQEQVRTANSDATLARVEKGLHNAPEGQWAVNVQTDRMGERFAPENGANPRNYGILSSEPSSEPHYSTFPQALVEPFIRAATSDRGVCAACGAQWVPVVEHSNMVIAKSDYAKASGNRTASSGTMLEEAQTNILDYWPSCTCPPQAPVPATVLDIFGGTMTTGIVARKLGRQFIGIDLSVPYLAIAVRRLADAKNAQQEMMLP